MSAPGTDAIGMLRWGLRRYALLFFACLLLGAAIAPLVAAKLAPPADAEALVIAQRLDMSLTALPRYGESVFDNGQVAQAVTAKFGAQTDVQNVVPTKVSLVDDQDSIVFHVVGHDADPKIAAGIANTAATTFIAALNAPGVGIGAFALQSPAQPPAPADQTLSEVIAVPMGIVAGLLLGLAAVFVLLVARRPVIDEAGVEEVTGVPALGTVGVPRTPRRRFARPEQFTGLVPVCRRLLRLPTTTIVVLSRRRDARARTRLSVALASVLMRVRDVTFIAPSELAEVARMANGGQEPQASAAVRLDVADPDRVTIVDSDDPLDLVQPPEHTATVLVARVGISSARLRAAVAEHLGGSAEARVVLVRPGRRTRGELPRGAAGAKLADRDVVLADER